MRTPVAPVRGRHGAANAGDRSWLPTPGEVAEALHAQEARDTLRPPSLRSEPAPRSWAIHVPAEEWAKIPAWWSGGHWFDALLDWTLTPEREKARQRWHVADATLLAIAHVLRYAAEPATGRHVTLSYATIRARVLANTEAAEGRTIRLKADESVRLAIRTLEAGGFVHVHATGRNLLSREEKAEAFETHGAHQEQAANVMALTLPALQAVDNSAPVDPILGLTASNPSKPSSSVDLEQQSPRGMERAPRARPNRNKVLADNPSTPVPEKGRSIDRLRLVAHLDRHYGGVLAGPRLGRSGKLLTRHIGQLDHALTAAGVDLDAWTWWQIADLVDARHSGDKTTAQQRIAAAADPLRYFIWMVKQVITPGEQPRTIIRTTPVDHATPSPARAEESQRPAPLPPVERERVDATIREIHRQAADDLQTQRTRRALDRRRITDVLLGEGMHPSDFPTVVRKLHTEVQQVHDLLTNRGWQLDHHELDHGNVLWTNPRSSADVEDHEDLNAISTIRFTPPGTADDRETYVLNTAGQEHTDSRINLGALIRAAVSM
ncbi:hypothetical protein ACF1AJ_19415 [Leifsonia sp. NPDC014704]|uniref:Uncharacterized protein n=1 Tax=Leifsonia virtsii TaxID=3035915 RepID=A0ABT8J2I3_9MICO|nr:hypothetical protein [Leifsonia virtsii]MDN4599291.1 hypothetical protein [Leifsonia virtsii]